MSVKKKPVQQLSVSEQAAHSVNRYDVAPNRGSSEISISQCDQLHIIWETYLQSYVANYSTSELISYVIYMILVHQPGSLWSTLTTFTCHIFCIQHVEMISGQHINISSSWWSETRAVMIYQCNDHRDVYTCTCHIAARALSGTANSCFGVFFCCWMQINGKLAQFLFHD